MKLTISLAGSAFAFLLATTCCWLPWVAVLIGGSVVGTSAFSAKLERGSGPLMVLGAGSLLYGAYTFWQKRNVAPTLQTIVLRSCITCPKCGFSKTETMPTDACQFFYECDQCHAVLKPLKGDCCVFCSYATVQCPPMQTGDKDCCSNISEI